MKNERFQVSLDFDSAEFVRGMSDVRGVSMSRIIAEMLREYIEEKEDRYFSRMAIEADNVGDKIPFEEVLKKCDFQ